MQKINKYYFLILIALVPLLSFSQDKPWTVQINGGPTLFYGDIMDFDYMPAIDSKEAWNFSGSLILEKRLTDYLTLRGQVLYGQTGGINASKEYFEASLLDYSLQARLDILDSVPAWRNPERPIEPYLFAGAGMSNWDSKLYDQNDVMIGRSGGPYANGFLEMTSEGFMPAGFGVAFRVNNHFDINFEESIRISNSDMLDARIGNAQYDMVSFTSLGLTYKFGQKKKSASRPSVQPAAGAQQQPGPTTQEKLQTEEKEFEVSVDINMPQDIEAGNTFMAKIIIKKGSLRGPATFRQVFPEGFNLQATNLVGGEYNFMNQVFTINWNEMPVNEELQIMYRITVSRDVEGGTYPISGIFTYTRKANSKLLAFKNNIMVLNPEQSPVTTTTTTQPVGRETSIQETGTTASGFEKRTDGVVFRVQIRAKYKKPLSTDYLASQYGLYEPIYEDYHNGYYIYTVGQFSNYEDAKQKRNQLVTRFGVKDAFVVAFVNGKRLDKLSKIKDF
jgi:hypothetical protein